MLLKDKLLFPTEASINAEAKKIPETSQRLLTNLGGESVNHYAFDVASYLINMSQDISIETITVLNLHTDSIVS